MRHRWLRQAAIYGSVDGASSSAHGRISGVHGGCGTRGDAAGSSSREPSLATHVCCSCSDSSRAKCMRGHRSVEGGGICAAWTEGWSTQALQARRQAKMWSAKCLVA
jgi:hypothetical protein